MPELLKQSDVAVLPSYHEGLPLFLLEAAATGLPLVATEVGGCASVIQNEVNGLLVPAKNGPALAEAIETVALDPELRSRMGKASRQLAKERFDLPIILEQYLELYRRTGTVQ